MGQDWKTLSLVVIGAALAGWLLVRTMRSDSRPHASSPSAAVATVPAPQRTAAIVAAAPVATQGPKAPGSVGDDAPAASGDAEAALIQRDLEVLSQSLVKDQRIEDRVMPRVNDVLDVPGITSYRRGPDFWESALSGGSAEMKQ